MLKPFQPGRSGRSAPCLEHGRESCDPTFSSDSFPVTRNGTHPRTVELRAWRSEESGGTLCLHGFGMSPSTFDPLAPPLLESGPVVAMGMCGMGRSGYLSAGERYSADTFCGDAAEIASTFGLKRPLLVGASYGGLVALRLAGAHPDAFAGIVLIDLLPDTNERYTQGLKKLVEKPFRELRDAVGMVRTAERFRGFKPEETWPDTVARLRERFVERDGAWYMAIDPRLGELLNSRHFLSFDDDASRVTCPVLLVRGGRSKIVTDAAINAFSTRVGEISIETVPGAGHEVTADSPAALADCIARFNRRIRCPESKSFRAEVA